LDLACCGVELVGATTIVVLGGRHPPACGGCEVHVGHVRALFEAVRQKLSFRATLDVRTIVGGGTSASSGGGIPQIALGWGFPSITRRATLGAATQRKAAPAKTDVGVWVPDGLTSITMLGRVDPLASVQAWEVYSAVSKSCPPRSRKVCSSAAVGRRRPACRHTASALGNAAGPLLPISMQAPSWNSVPLEQGLLAWKSEESFPSRVSALAALLALVAVSAWSESATLESCAFR
jgi:hypothetical protein